MAAEVKRPSKKIFCEHADVLLDERVLREHRRDLRKELKIAH